MFAFLIVCGFVWYVCSWVLCTKSECSQFPTWPLNWVKTYMVPFLWDTLSHFLCRFHQSNLACNLVYMLSTSSHSTPPLISLLQDGTNLLPQARWKIFYYKQTSDTQSAVCIKHKQCDERKMTTKKGQNSDLLSVLPSHKTDGCCRGALETFLICHTLDLAGMTTSGFGYFLWVLRTASSTKAATWSVNCYGKSEKERCCSGFCCHRLGKRCLSVK